MNEVGKQIETLYKDKYGQFISLVLGRFPDLSIESAEDIVQEAFTNAAENWMQHGVPENPSGWIYMVCKNKSINFLRKKSKTVHLSSAADLSVTTDDISEHHFKDAQLLMLIACCHPELAPRTQVAMALKYVANLRIENIAQQLGVNMEAVEKMLYRARQKIKTEALILSANDTGFSREKLSIVHKVIYLIFNEGYKQEGSNLSQGKILCEEALILNKTLFDSPWCNPETKALQALMLFNIARFDSRFDEMGKAIELEYQDRSQWNLPVIRLAHQILLDSEDAGFSPYHLEASICCMHCTAKKFEDTNWEAICKYYETLLKIYPSPFAEINYAVSLQYNRQPDKAYAILMELYKNPYFNRFHLLNISLGKYFDRLGDKEKAQTFFAKAEKIRSHN